MVEPAKPSSGNFAFLAEHEPLLLRLCVSAERNYHDDPNTTVIKLRQFGEAVVRHLAAIFNISATQDQTQADLLKALQVRRVIDRNVADLLHYLRREGNQAAHQFETTVQQAKSALKIARELALWFHRAMGKGDAKTFNVGSFVEPARPDHEYRLAELSTALELKVEEVRAANQFAEAERLKREAAEAQAASTALERTVWEQLAQEEEKERQRLSAEFEQTLSVAEKESERKNIDLFFSTFTPVPGNGDSLPANWIATHVGAIGVVSNGSTPSRKEAEFWCGEIPWVSSGEVRNNAITSTRERITESGYKNSSVRLLPIGTVLIAMIGEGKTRGQTALLGIMACINQNIAGVVPIDDLIVSKYLWYWFQAQYENNRVVGSGTGPQALNCQRVRELPVNLPPKSEQIEIIRRVEALFTLADRLEARAGNARARVDTLTPATLAKAFRGELVPQDQNDEPASFLLERIRSDRQER